MGPTCTSVSDAAASPPTAFPNSSKMTGLPAYAGDVSTQKERGRDRERETGRWGGTTGGERERKRKERRGGVEREGGGGEAPQCKGHFLHVKTAN